MKQIIKLNEEDLQHIISESVNKILNESCDEGVFNTLGGYLGRRADKAKTNVQNSMNKVGNAANNAYQKAAGAVNNTINKGKEAVNNKVQNMKNDWQSAQRDSAYKDMVTAFNNFQKYWNNYLKNGGNKSGMSKQFNSQIASIAKALNNYQVER
jgi:hypothetical protein